MRNIASSKTIVWQYVHMHRVKNAQKNDRNLLFIESGGFWGRTGMKLAYLWQQLELSNNR